MFYVFVFFCKLNLFDIKVFFVDMTEIHQVNIIVNIFLTVTISFSKLFYSWGKTIVKVTLCTFNVIRDLLLAHLHKFLKSFYCFHLQTVLYNPGHISVCILSV